MSENFYKADVLEEPKAVKDSEEEALSEDFPEDDAEFNRVMDKFDKFGEFSLTAAEHHAIGSTPDEDLLNNPGKAEYEVISDEKLIKILDSHIKCLLNHSGAYKPGEYEASLELVGKAIPFLKSVGRLPAKYNDFNLEALNYKQSA